MNDVRVGPAQAVLPHAGDVAYFVDLHLDSVRDEGAHPQKEDIRCYRAEGKTRPMYVVATSFNRDRGKRWFTVLSITRAGRDGRGRLRDGHLHIGNCICPDRDSYVDIRPQLLPENMISRKAGASPVVQPCDRLGFDNARRIIDSTMWRRSGGE